MKKVLVVGALIVPLVATGLYVASQRPARANQAFRSGIFDPPREAPAFSLIGSNGKTLSLRDHHDKVVILGFGYTSCPYVCPLTLTRLTDVYKKLGSASRDVQLIYVTVDPERDSPERLRQFLAGYNPNFLGATGTHDQLASVLNAYGIVAEQVVAPNHASGYDVDHSSFLYLVDRQGRLRGLVPIGTSVDDVAHDLELLLNMHT